MTTSHTIWKSLLKPSPHPQQLNIPIGSTMLDVRVLDGTVAIWYKCNPSLPTCARFFQVVPTGFPLESESRYVGTFTAQNPVDELLGSLVFHVFELEPEVAKRILEKMPSS